MTRRIRIKWSFGDLFAVPLKDKTYGLLQVVDLMMTNVVYVAIFNKKTEQHHGTISMSVDDIISLIAITKEGLDFGYFNLVGNTKLYVNKNDFNNEKFASKGYVGAKIYDYGLVIDFLNAYHGLEYWDNWINPNYLDDFLIDLGKKPKYLKLKNKKTNS
jgi:hypothetical protein